MAIIVDDPQNAAAVESLAAKEKFSFPMLLATPEVAGVYNIIYRYLFDRRRDLGFPTSFLIDAKGEIVKVYQGRVTCGARGGGCEGDSADGGGTNAQSAAVRRERCIKVRFSGMRLLTAWRFFSVGIWSRRLPRFSK